MITIISRPQDYPHYNCETNGYTQQTIFSLTPIYSSAEKQFYLVAYRIINRKRFNISKFIDDLISLDNKINLITVLNDEDFILFSDSLES